MWQLLLPQALCRLYGLLTHILAKGAASGNVLQGHDLHHKSQCKVATKLYTTS